jgi:hypothetical protein
MALFLRSDLEKGARQQQKNGEVSGRGLGGLWASNTRRGLAGMRLVVPAQLVSASSITCISHELVWLVAIHPIARGPIRQDVVVGLVGRFKLLHVAAPRGLF